jgi:hypothetical protein
MGKYRRSTKLKSVGSTTLHSKKKTERLIEKRKNKDMYCKKYRITSVKQYKLTQYQVHD